MPPAVLATPRARSAALPFAANGVLYGTWAARIPEVQAQAGLSEGELGLALVGAAVGLVVSASAAGPLVARLGAHRVTLAALLLFAVAVVGPGLATGLGSLAVALVGLGLSTSTPLIFASIVLFGMTIGNLLMMQPLLMAERFGVRDYPTIFGRSQAIGILGVAGGPLLIGWLFDVFGSYRAPYSIAAVLSFVGMLILSTAGSANRPVPTEAV